MFIIPHAVTTVGECNTSPETYLSHSSPAASARPFLGSRVVLGGLSLSRVEVSGSRLLQ